MHENFEAWIKTLYEMHLQTATVNMNEEQKEIYKIGFDNAVNLASTYIQFQDEMMEEEVYEEALARDYIEESEGEDNE